MFSSLLAAPCELKVHLLQHVVFLRPPTTRPTEDALPTSNDEVARGLVELNVPTDRRIDGIRVKLRAVQSVAILPDQRDMIAFAGATPIAWEDTVLMEKVVEIGVPPKRSHATVPGDDSISSERRGRSRVSRNATPSGSRQHSPRQSAEVTRADAPPIYEESVGEERANRHERAPNGHHTPTVGGIGAVIRAFSRSRPQSRSVSRAQSRAGSRDSSPARDVQLTTSREHANAASTPRQDVGTSSSLTPSRSPSTHNIPVPPPLSRDNSDDVVHAQESNAEVVTLAGHFSRTGLSMGRSNASGPHPHASDQDDHFGVGPSNVSGGVMRGRGGYGNLSSSSHQDGIGQRSATVSPSRGFTRQRREESRARFGSMGKKNVRAPSADVAGRSSSHAGANDQGHGGLFLQKGVHGFEFAFILPADSPPYERSPFGRVRYVVKATAFGAGRAKSNLETWQDMFPVVNPAQDGGPMPLTVLYNDVHPTVGVLSVACTSNNISVGGIFSVDIHSPTPPHDLVVYLVRVSVETSIELRTRKKGKQHVPTQRHKLFEKGWVPPRATDPHGPGDGKKSEGIIRDPSRPGSRPDDAWTVQGVARMPNDNIVRSTTHSRTRAAIRFTHQLLVEVVHSRQPDDPVAERKIKVFALRQPITLPSCCVAFDAVTLPAYSANDDSARSASMPYDIGNPGDNTRPTMHSVDSNGNMTSTPVTGDSPRGARSPSRTRTHTAARLTGPGHELCVCGQTIADLSDRERCLMPARPMGELPLDGLSHRKIGELPSRGSGGEGSSGFSPLGRNTSRSSSTSHDSRRERSASIGRRSLSIARNMTRARSPSVSSTSSARGRRNAGSTTRRRSPSSSSITRHTNESQRFAGRPLPGMGDRGEGVIRTGRRGSVTRTSLSDASSDTTAASGPPSYEHAVVEEERVEEEAADAVAQSRGRTGNGANAM